MDEHLKTEIVKLEGDISGVITTKGENPTILYAVFSCAAWPDSVRLKKCDAGMLMYEFDASFVLPDMLVGRFLSTDQAISKLVECLSDDAVKGFTFRNQVEPDLDFDDLVEAAEKPEEPLVQWEDRYREGAVRVHETRLKDHSLFATMSVSMPRQMTFHLHKRRDQTFYRFRDDKLPIDLKGSYSTVRQAARALHNYCRIEAIAVKA